MTNAFSLDERIVALMLIAGAFHVAQHPLGYEAEAVFGMRVRDAHRDGMRGAGDLAFAALQREGYAPYWSEGGNVRTIQLGTIQHGTTRPPAYARAA
jgi:hypothetical protein